MTKSRKYPPQDSHKYYERRRSGKTARQKSVTPAGLHPRNPHRGRYDFAALVRACPKLEGYLRANPKGDQTIDFADAKAVRLLNQALLAHFYQVHFWEIPETYLCPPIPGRADYLHHLADLLATQNAGGAPRGKQIHVLDIGTGANCVYPLIGAQSFGWQFVASDIDPVSVSVARLIVQSNPTLKAPIKVVQQAAAEAIFEGVIKPGQRFELTVCNPPFHASKSQALAGNRRKRKNLGDSRPEAALNFGGQKAELWCPGGELEFLRRMIRESVAFSAQVCWFTSLVSKGENLAPLQKCLHEVGAHEVRVIPMHQGQKVSRLLVWSFLSAELRARWGADWHYRDTAVS